MDSKHHNTWQAAPAANSFSSLSPATSEQDRTKSNMHETFQTWALKTYGDKAKTKTVTRKKYNRILKILKGEEKMSYKNSKFRHWVKAKGFQIGNPNGHRVTNDEQVLYIPGSKVLTNGEMSLVYKKVAVVEDFYDIIYEAHAIDGFRGKHAGQKKTYKVIAEMYSFLPREAVSHFLILCTECQKRMCIRAEQSGASSSHENLLDENVSLLDTKPDNNPLPIDYNFPLTYMKHMQSLDYSEEDGLKSDQDDSEDNKEANSSQYTSVDAQMYDVTVIKEQFLNSLTSTTSHAKIKRAKLNTSLKSLQGSMSEEPINIIKGSFTNNHYHPLYEETASSCNGCPKGKDSTPSDLSVNTKDEINEDSEKIDINIYDPNRFEAFKMFVCLFVDENLDCMIPISRQPKNKIRAIIDSCSRQFPEFAKKASKQIQTYLKSCRQNKQTEENSSWKLGRNTQLHLISDLAEESLATACKNESQNAQRMHMGLKPIPANINQGKSKNVPLQPNQEKCATPCLVNGTESLSFFPYHLVPSNIANGHANSITDTNNGSTDLNMEKGVCSQSSTSKHSLNPSEVISMKQLIAGYREAATNLLRSADELEQLLLELNAS